MFPHTGPPHLPAPAAGGSRQSGAALLRGSGEASQLVSENPNPRGTRYRWKTPDVPPRLPPHRNPGKGSRMGGQTLGTPLAHRFLGCVFMVPESCSGLRALRGASCKEQPVASGATPICPGVWTSTALLCPGVGFGQIPRGWEQRGGPCTPSPGREAAATAAAGQAQHHGCALARTQWPGPPGRGD